MRLRAIDLNLLVIFDALMTERHVTRAASKVALSQPAMSNALSRLRHVFQDELFLRTARGMEPTPRALELADAVRSIVHQSERLVTSATNFDPASSERVFSARMSDLVGFLMLPALAERMRMQAPKASLNVLHMAPERTVKALEADQLDFAVSMELQHQRTVRAEPLFRDRMVCVMRADHPVGKGRLTLAKFLSVAHARVSMSPTDIRFVDNVLANRGLARTVALNVPHWLLIPKILQRTDLISVISERMAGHFANDGLAVHPLPYPTTSFTWTMYWHRRYDKSLAHTWMRDIVKDVATALAN